MFKRLLWMLIGAVAALQLERWVKQRRERLRPSALAGSLLDRVNRSLEASRASGG
jgi:hypothetical protein